eukprot:1139412-Pelagomonas_calceolata.AAC.10
MPILQGRNARRALACRPKNSGAPPSKQASTPTGLPRKGEGKGEGECLGVEQYDEADKQKQHEKCMQKDLRTVSICEQQQPQQ